MKKEVSSLELTKDYLDKIKNKEKDIDAYLSIVEDKAIDMAKKADERIHNSDNITNLTGIPYALKDNMCTKDIKTTCGSRMLENFVPPYNATVYEKLMGDGAVLLGKLNMDEFAMGSSNENSYFKKTKNPYGENKVPGGSSGGSAASVAADETIFSLGSDTGGSIRQPAAFCKVVGMKPTYGRVSRYGLVAFASSLDQIGPLTKDVTDCAMVLNSIAGHDKLDSTSANIEVPDFLDALTGDVKGMKIAYIKEYLEGGIQPEIKQSIENALKLYEKMGAHVEAVSMDLTDYALPAYYIISSAEASSNLARYDGIKYGYSAKDYNGLDELYKFSRSEGFGDEVKRRIMLGTYALSSGYYDAYYKKALQVRTLIKESYNNIFSKFDVILTPATPTTAFGIGEKSEDPVEMYLADIFTVSLNIAGLPGMVIPSGMDKNKMPIGMQLIGKAFDEMSILKAAYAYEKEKGGGFWWIMK